MLLTSLLSLALSINASVVGTHQNDNEGVGEINLPQLTLDENLYTQVFYEFYLPSSYSYTTISLNKHVDIEFNTNYNEYFEVSVTLDFSNEKIDVSYLSWLHYNYNVSVFTTISLNDSQQGGYEFFSWSSPTQFLVQQGSTIQSFRGSDSLSYSFDGTTSYWVHCYTYLFLLTDTDFDEIVNSDYQTGYNQGYDDGYNYGHHVGYEQGTIISTDDAYNRGYADGRNYGYILGLQTTTYTFKDLFGSIADTPILMLRRLFGFELFGTSLMTVFVSLFTANIIIVIFLKIWKGRIGK